MEALTEKPNQIELVWVGAVLFQLGSVLQRQKLPMHEQNSAHPYPQEMEVDEFERIDVSSLFLPTLLCQTWLF